MLLLYALAYIVMHHMAIGRYIYAVGREIARQRGSRVCLSMVSICLSMASVAPWPVWDVWSCIPIESGAPQFGDLYELKAIAAVGGRRNQPHRR